MQTGAPCAACHIGAFGPQLTPFGMAFKIGGYTLAGAGGLQAYSPLSAMAIGSFTNTGTAVPPAQTPQHYNTNDNPSLDLVSLFLAGRVSDYTGGFSEYSYSNVNNAVNFDNLDLRPYTRVFQVDGKDLRIGSTLNNSPTIQDPYNTTFAWGYPYDTSFIAPTPVAQPILANGFVRNSIGYTAYAWYDSKLYLEAGGYSSSSSWLLARMGDPYGVGAIQGVAPYLRAAYQWDWDSQSAHLGAIFMGANVNPTTGAYMTDGARGRNSYQDYGIDAGYMWLDDGSHIVTSQGIFVHEVQNLQGTANSVNAAGGTAYGSGYSLNQIRVNASYWYRNTYGATIGWQRSWGPANPVLYQPAPLYGSANGKPNSNEFILEADWVPFGKAGSFAAPWINLKLGLQYTIYTQFNGGTSNYDGYGRSASGNNTFLLFAWMAF